MCGICGIDDYAGGEPVDRRRHEAMAASLRHRGPDDDGFHVDGSLGLGFRRLSIIDLTTGHQPMADENETAHLLFGTPRVVQVVVDGVAIQPYYDPEVARKQAARLWLRMGEI